MKELIDQAIAELDDYMFDHPQEDVSDYIFELADSYVPVYNAELLRLAQNNLWLANTEPEILAFNGESTAINAIAGNVYQELSDHLHQYAYDNEDKYPYPDDLYNEVEALMDGVEDKDNIEYWEFHKNDDYSAQEKNYRDMYEFYEYLEGGE